MADKKKLQAAIKATVEELAENGQGTGREQAQQIVALAAYLADGETPADLYAELTGVADADESFLRTIAAEKAENEGWDFDALIAIALFAIRLAGSVLGIGATAEHIAKAVASATSPNPESEDNPSGASALELLLG